MNQMHIKGHSGTLKDSGSQRLVVGDPLNRIIHKFVTQMLLS